MHINVYEYDCYRAFIKDWVQAHPRGPRGLYTKIAKDSGVPAVIISQTLSGSRNFSMDQAYAVAENVGLVANKQWDYFSLLVERDKSASQSFSSFVNKKILKLRSEHFKVSKLSFASKKLSKERAQIYYSDLNLCLTRAVVEICKGHYTQIISKLELIGINENLANQCLSTLVDLDLIQKKDNIFILKTKSFHLDKSSDSFKLFKSMLHNFLRGRFGEVYAADNINYHSISTLDDKTALDFKSDLLKLIKSYSKKVSVSEATSLHVLNLEYIKVL